MTKTIIFSVLFIIFLLIMLVNAESLENIGVKINIERITYSFITNLLLEGNSIQYKFSIFNEGNKNLSNLELLYEIGTNNKDAPVINDKINFNLLNVEDSIEIYTPSYYLAQSGPYTLKLLLKSDQGEIPIEGVSNWLIIRDTFRVWPSTVILTSLISLSLVILYLMNLSTTRKSFNLSRLPLVTIDHAIDGLHCYSLNIIFKNISQNLVAKNVEGRIRIVCPIKQKFKDKILDKISEFIEIRRKNIIKFSISHIYPIDEERIRLFDKLRGILNIQGREYINDHGELIPDYRLDEELEFKLYINYKYASDMDYYTDDFKETLHIKMDRNCICKIINYNKINIL